VAVKKGFVHVVGAGPGDPGLLTQRGLEALEKADLIIHDGLLGDAFEKALPRRPMRLSLEGDLAVEPVHLAIAAAREGRRVVLLHVGDPFLFAGGDEDVDGLRKARTAYEIIPGVSAATAAAAEYAIPLTAAECAQGVMVLPGRKGAEVDWRHAARFEGTLVVMMGTSELPAICRRLVRFGRPAATPVAVIERASWSDSRAVVGTLGDIGGKAKRAKVRSPTVTIIGEVVRRSPLLGQRRYKPRRVPKRRP